MTDVLLFLSGLAFQWLWLSYWLLPLVYGFPRAAYYTWRGTLRRASMLAWVRTAALWTVLFTGTAVFVVMLGWRDLTLNSGSLWLGQLLGLVSFAAAYPLSRRGRESLNSDFWRGMASYRLANARLARYPMEYSIALLHGGHRVNDYFIDAVRVFACTLDPVVRQAALTAGIVADRVQRSVMVTFVRYTAAKFGDIEGTGKIPARLTLLADEIAAKDWTIGDVTRAKRILWKMHREYAESLDAFDSSVFRRRFPELFPPEGVNPQSPSA